MDARSSAISTTGASHGRRDATARRAAWTEIPTSTQFAQVPAVTCPTCLAADDAALDCLAGAEHPGVAPATCPTCGVTSIEYGLTLALDATLAELKGLERLDDAL